MAKRILFASMLITVLSAGAVSIRQITTPAKAFPSCSSPFCSQAHPNTCGVCICNLPQGVCTRDPIGVVQK